MTTLAQGASVTVAVRDGGTIAIATNGGFGSAVVTETGGSAVTVSFGPAPERRVLGPYKEGASVVLTNSSSGAFDYDVETQFDPSNVAITGGGIQGSTVVGPYVGQNGANRMAYRKIAAKVLSGSRARIILLGDSTTVGAGGGTNSGGTSGLVGARVNNYPTRLAAALTAAGVPAYNEAIFGEQNISGAGETYSAYDPRLSTTWTLQNLSCMGKNGWTTTTSGATWSFTPTMTFDRFDVYTSTAPGLGSVTVNVDGGATLATINMAGSNNIVKTTVTCTRGTHTINITSTSTSQVFVFGVVPWDSTLGGLDIVQGGWWGGTMNNTTFVSNPWMISNPANWTALAPDLVVLQLTINDANAARDPALYAADLSTTAGAITTYGAELLLMSGIPSQQASETNGSLDAIVQRVSSYAAANGKVYADLRSRCGNSSTISAAGWLFDDKHGNAKFYADEGRWLARVLLDELQ